MRCWKVAWLFGLKARFEISNQQVDFWQENGNQFVQSRGVFIKLVTDWPDVFGPTLGG